MTTALGSAIGRVRAAGMSIHTILVSHDGERRVDVSAPGFSADAPHRVYSVSKSVTGLAVLLLADRGMLDLDDPIMRHFPEQRPVHPWLEATSIDELLSMTGPHRRTTFVGDRDWLASYFQAAPTHRPGTLFTYDTSASYVLAALVERLTGEPLHRMLRRDLFAPLGASGPAGFVTGPEGIAHGGSGLIATPSAMLAVAEAVNAGGAGVLPGSVVDRFLEPRSDPRPQQWAAPFRHAYGRQVWLPAEGVWMMFGLGGQLVLGVPDRGVTAVITADTTPVPGGDQWLAAGIVDALAAAGPDELRPDGIEEDDLSGTGPSAVRDGAASARLFDGGYALLTGKRAPASLTLETDADGCRLHWDHRAPVRFAPGRAVIAGDTSTTAAWRSPDVLDVEIATSAVDIATLRIRLVACDDATLTVDAQAFGPEAAPEDTWRGTFRRVSP